MLWIRSMGCDWAWSKCLNIRQQKYLHETSGEEGKPSLRLSQLSINILSIMPLPLKFPVHYTAKNFDHYSSLVWCCVDFLSCSLKVLIIKPLNVVWEGWYFPQRNHQNSTLRPEIISWLAPALQLEADWWGSYCHKVKYFYVNWPRYHEVHADIQ